MSVKKIGARINKALKEKGLERKDLIKKLHGTHQRISGWINGIHYPPLEALEEIIKMTGKDANYFFGLPSAPGNNHIVGDNNKNISQTVNYSSDIESLKNDVALIKQAILDLQRKK